MRETHEALGRDLVAAAVLRGNFRLRSGVQSNYYIDKYLFTTRPDLLRRIADELATRLPAGVERVAGPVLGAIPLVTAVSLATELPMLIVRVDEAKEYVAARNKIGPPLRLGVLRVNLRNFAHRDIFIEGIAKAGVPE